jgi:hypothetical protein
VRVFSEVVVVSCSQESNQVKHQSIHRISITLVRQQDHPQQKQSWYRLVASRLASIKSAIKLRYVLLRWMGILAAKLCVEAKLDLVAIIIAVSLARLALPCLESLESGSSSR